MPHAGLLYAPTPTDEPLPWPALLVAPFPLDPGRRHVAAGPATDALVEQAALAYADLLRDQARRGHSVWSLIPVGLAAGALDGALREALRRVLPGTPLLPAAEHHPHESEPVLLKPRDAVVLEPQAGADPVVVAGLAPVVAGLVLAPRSAGPALDLLGVRRLALADVVEQLPTCPTHRPGTGCMPRWRGWWPIRWPANPSPRCRCRSPTAGWCAVSGAWPCRRPAPTTP